MIAAGILQISAGEIEKNRPGKVPEKAEITDTMSPEFFRCFPRPCVLL